MRLLIALILFTYSFAAHAATGSVSTENLSITYLEEENIEVATTLRLTTVESLIVNVWSQDPEPAGNGPACADWAESVCDQLNIDVGTTQGFAAWSALYLSCTTLTGEPEQ